jgi:metal-dependent amidase/aminoacylase/carboxypeptidase family protein
VQSLEVEYVGHSAHAGMAPWQGTNALDAAVLAYQGIAVLRQQVQPDHRVHGILQGSKDMAPNGVLSDQSGARKGAELTLA